MGEFWSIIGNTANIIGIISLPWAIIELFILKSRVKKAQESMKEMIILKDYQTLSSVSSIVLKIQEDLSKVINNHNKQGTRRSSLQNQCQSIIGDINKCIAETPSKYEELTKKFIGCKQMIQRYIETSIISDLIDAQNYIHLCISMIKQLCESTLNDEAERIARGN